MINSKLLINGQWVEAKETELLTSPYSDEVIASIPIATVEHVEQSIQAAYNSRDVMKEMPSHQRAQILANVAKLLEERTEEAATILAKEVAKPYKYALGEVARTIQTYKVASEEAKRITGELIPMDAAPGGENRLAYTQKEPLGVVGAITPFNFPLNLVAHKVGPAIAAGNTVVLKPAPQTPLSAFFTGVLFMEAGLPAGALNIVTGDKEIGEMIVTDERIKKLSFTGSPTVGKRIQSQAGLKKVTLELGSNAAVIIDKDVELDEVMDRCIMGSFSNQGQVCISLQRVYVHEQLYEAFVTRMVEATSKLVIGDPLKKETDVSALITKQDVLRVSNWIEEAVKRGAELKAGGEVQGNIITPAVLTNVAHDSKLSCEEVFGPIVTINKITSVDEAIEKVNDSRFGLQAGIYTNNIHTAMSAANKLHVGGVMINDIPTFRVDHMPYGGVKESGIGREGIKYAIDEMTELKLIVLKMRN